MENRYLKCKIYLSCNDYENIRIRDNNILALKYIFEGCPLKNNIKKLGYCDLRNASGIEIIQTVSKTLNATGKFQVP